MRSWAADKFDVGKHFCNKIWQAVRFAIELAGDKTMPLPDETAWTLPDRWILDALARAAGRTSRALDEFDFAEAAQTLYGFLWNQVCDVYIEIAKDKAPTRAPVLTHVLGSALQLLHPIMPFVTEELWNRLGRDELIGTTPWPKAIGLADDTSRAQMERILEFVEAVRALRALPQLPYREMRDVTVVGADAALLELLRAQQSVVARLARTEQVREAQAGNGRPEHAVSRRLGGVELLLPVDAAFVEKERAAVDKEIERAANEAAAIERKLQTNFVEKAPPAVVDKERARLEELRQALALSQERRNALK